MENTIEKWVNEDGALHNLIVEIQSLDKTEVEQAEIAFNELCELFDLPKMPNDLERYQKYDDDIEDPDSDNYLYLYGGVGILLIIVTLDLFCCVSSKKEEIEPYYLMKTKKEI